VSDSVTKEVIIELERARIYHLNLKRTTTLGTKEYERWFWEAWTEMSLVFFLSPSDHFGYISDPHYQIAMTASLGQPCPAMAPVSVMVRFFRK